MMHLFVILCFAWVGLAKAQEQNETDVLSRFATPCTTPNQDLALCLEIHKCPLFSKIQMDPNHESYDFLQASNCGPSNAKVLRVCCGKHTNFQSQIEKNQKSSEAPDTKPETIVNTSGPLPKKCGKQTLVNLRNRIFGGTEASLGEFPWLVRLIHKHPNGYRNFGCGGFLIHRKFVLTAAHCVSSKSVEIFGPLHQVVLGEHDLEEDIDCTKTKPVICADEPVYVDTSPPIIYSGFDKSNKNHNNDIAIIPLKKPVNFTNFIQPLCLLEAPSQMQTMYITGWGKTESDDHSNNKLKVEVPRVPQQICIEKYKTIDVFLNKKNQICAGAEGKDSCSGDSGGPLMVEIDGTWYAEGIVSFGYGCAKAEWPGVYANVPKYANWVKNSIQQRLAKNKRKRRT